MSAESGEVRWAGYGFEIELAATRDQVWAALVDPQAWWPADFHVLGPDSVLSFEARAGGLLLERQAGMASLLWYQVQLCDPGSALQMVGHLAPDWGGPATSMLSFGLESRPTGTMLRVRDSLIGRFGAETLAALEAGWRGLFGNALVAHFGPRN